MYASLLFVWGTCMSQTEHYALRPHQPPLSTQLKDELTLVTGTTWRRRRQEPKEEMIYLLLGRKVSDNSKRQS